jgi:hypothetical protein
MIVLRYHVPQAAIPTADGHLQYAIDIDPQGTVIPASYTVLLRLPEGYHEEELEGDWGVNPDLTLQLENPDGLRMHATVTVVPD